ncbi:MAG TPA: bifunctional phosphoserine phosphatase/homoserine phosphotransferase ThrH [Lentisphaeria bacterium]|nr:MAG: phosphoserine phosphatase [Lentisphaerae bacterium ADurb.Bin082]HPY91359.1 bifunctional phosphoserine phosphatase/homoserine phosphotransferase ThrH [Lentisphaeria bacterium]HQL88664.1 bifunctional phosphoserine phosphatase/homoserine phosphotransferase ThrH [Lentisphaeria bacterium]
MPQKPLLVAMDLEGVLVPEVWISVAEKTGIPELRLTTRDFSDYSALMSHRMKILDQHRLTLRDIQDVINTMQPLPGAVEYLNWLRERHQAIILSDTFYEFASPLMQKLGWPTLFCNSIHADENGRVTGYTMRVDNGKKRATLAFKQLNFRVIAMGDSYNDTDMLKEADLGILFRPSENVRREFPQFQVVSEFTEVVDIINAFCNQP